MLLPFVPNHVYLDTSVVIAALVSGVPNARASEAFCARLVQQRSHVYCSQILRLELSQAIRNLASRLNQLPLQTQRQYRLDDWQTDVSVRQRWMSEGIRRYEAFIGRFEEFFVLPFLIPTWEQSVEVMVLHQMKSLDA